MNTRKVISQSHVAKAGGYLACAWSLGPTLSDKAAIFWKLTKNLRVRLGLDHHYPTQRYRLNTAYGALTFRDNFGDITNLFKIFYQKEYAVGPLNYPGAIVDVGSNIGLAAAWFAIHYPGSPIYCIEPLKENANLIRINCPSAQVETTAMGSEPGQVRLAVDPDRVMASGIEYGRAKREEEFEVITLDRFVSTRQIGQISLLKVDVEGMEAEVLRGGLIALSATSRVVLETHGRETHEVVAQLLTAAGFVLEPARFNGRTGLISAFRPGAPSA